MKIPISSSSTDTSSITVCGPSFLNHSTRIWANMGNARDAEECEWTPYDPSTYVPPPSKAPEVDDPENFFRVKIMYNKPGGKRSLHLILTQTKADVVLTCSDTPDLLLCDWSKTLKRFMRFAKSLFYLPYPVLTCEHSLAAPSMVTRSSMTTLAFASTIFFI